MFKFTDVKNNVDRVEKANNSKKTDYSYDVIIISEYKTWEDLDTYIKHPEHQKAISLCKNIKKEKAVIDYEF